MSPVPLALIFGTGRSGSTWLGSIVDTHPAVAYRFEPLARLRDDQEIARIRDAIGAGGVDAALLARLRQRLLRADPSTSKPPFFSKGSAQWTAGRNTLWPVARLSRPSRALFRWLYSAHPEAPVVFKEVGLNRLALPLVRAGLPAVHLIRHPCGFVASVLKGQAARLMPTGRRSVIADLLAKHDPQLAERWAGRLAGASPAQLEALLWRIDAEAAMSACEGRASARLVIYEALCREPQRVAAEVFSHFGLCASAQTDALLAEMSSPDPARRKARGERWLNDYFSVFRDPGASAEKWKKELAAESAREVLAAVADSAAFQECSARGGWT